MNDKEKRTAGVGVLSHGDKSSEAWNRGMKALVQSRADASIPAIFCYFVTLWNIGTTCFHVDRSVQKNMTLLTFCGEGR